MNDFLIGDMDKILRIVVMLGSLGYIGIILYMLKKKHLTVRYSIIWLLSGIALLVFSIVPYIIFVIGNLLHVQVPSNLVFMMLFAFVLLLLLSLSSIVSGFAEKIKKLTQQQAFLEKRVRELEEKQDK